MNMPQRFHDAITKALYFADYGKEVEHVTYSCLKFIIKFKDGTIVVLEERIK